MKLTLVAIICSILSPAAGAQTTAGPPLSGSTKQLERSIFNLSAAPANPETAAWQNNIIAAGGTVTAEQVSAMDAFVTAAKQNGYWDNLLDVSPLAGGDLTAGLVKLKTYTGTPTILANNGFTAGNYSAAASFQGASGCYLDTGFNYANYGTGVLLGYSFYINDEFVPSSTVEGFAGHDYGNGAPLLGTYALGSVGGGVQFLSGGGSDLHTASLNGIGRGIYHFMRPSLSCASIYLNGHTIGIDTNATPDGVPAAGTTHHLLAGYGGVCLHRMSFGAIDDGLMGDAKAALFAADVTQLQRALGRFVPSATPLLFVPVVGQSLATGANGTPTLSTTQPYGNRAFNSYQPGDLVGVSSPYSFVPFTEYGNETSQSGAADLTSALWRADHPGDASMDVVVGNYATGGAPLSYIRKGGAGSNWADMLAEITAAKTLSVDYDTRLVVRYLSMMHGETDSQNADYQTEITSYQNDAQTDIPIITGQSEPVSLLVWQPSAWTSGVPGGTSGSATSLSPFELLAASAANPAKIILVGPKYIFPYGTGVNGVHLTNEGYRWAGEYEAKVRNRINRGGAWSPLCPASVVRIGATITVTMAGNVGDLVLDTVRVSDPGNLGFEWAQTGGAAQAISSVAVTGTNVVTITLSGDPGAPAAERLRYAYTGIVNNPGGPTSGPRGCLRDSDSSVASLHGNDLFNWCVHFDEPVLTPFAEWQSLYFTAGELSNPAISGLYAMPAGDGITNLMKYALNLDPKADGTGGLPTVSTTTTGGSEYLTLTYTKVLSAADITYTPEASGDLQNWSSGAGPITVSTTNNADGKTQTVVVRDAIPLSSAAERFLRLKVSMPQH